MDRTRTPLLRLAALLAAALLALAGCGREGGGDVAVAPAATTVAPTTTEPEPCRVLEALNAPAGSGVDPATRPRTDQAGSVHGRLVMDSAPAVGKTVRMASCGTPGLYFDVRSDADGNYRFDPVPAGSYIVRFGVKCLDTHLTSVDVTAGGSNDLGSRNQTC